MAKTEQDERRVPLPSRGQGSAAGGAPFSAAGFPSIMRETAMTLRVDLPKEQTPALEGRAKARGASAEQYARQVLEHDLAPE